MSGDFELSELRVEGEASCVGGDQPKPPLDGFPGLCHQAGHPVFGDLVFTADQRASVLDLATAIATTPDYEAVAGKYNTSADYVDQAVRYAYLATFLGTDAL